MFNDLNWGGYISLHLWPQQKVFADSMADVTGEVTLNYEIALTVSDGWENVLDTYKITWTILPSSAPLTVKLSEQGWQVLYEDATAIILKKP
jgi:hypothetical protein